MQGEIVMEFGKKTTVTNYLVRRLERGGKKVWCNKEIDPREGIVLALELCLKVSGSGTMSMDGLTWQRIILKQR